MTLSSHRRISILAVALACAATLVATATAAAAPGSVESERAVKADKSPPLRSMVAAHQPVGATAPQVRHREISGGSQSPLVGTPVTPLGVDPVQQTQAPSAAAPATLTSWDGVSNRDAVVPPDTEGDVGPNDYVQWVNLSFEIWSKTGTPLLGPLEANTLWSGFGGSGDVCASNNQGDPVVVYDRLADRWVFTQFGFGGSGNRGPYYMCMAVSQTGDPTGSYYRFEFQINASSGDFPDYPKLGVWPDGYYLTTNNFSHNSFAGAGFYAFDRTKMLAGDSSATMVTFPAPGSQYEGVLPATLTGPTAPPTGSPEYFGSVDTHSSSGTGSAFQIWKAHADFTTPANSTLSAVTDVAVAPYTWSFCGQLFPSGCIPQPGTTQTLDPLADRLMFRLQYRNFGDHETLVASHTVNVGSGSDQAGVRWYEIRSPGSSPFIEQQGTFAPNDGVNRWMGSAAMDGSGDIALGYSASDGNSTYPSVYYTGRLAGDPLGTMTQGEGALATGAGSQTGYGRWGDYSAMSIDPSDDKTFWYTQEYYSTTSSEGWQTRIGSFRLAAPGPAVTLTSPANGSYTSNTAPTFSGTAGTAPGDSSVTVNIYSGTGTGGTLVQTRTATVGSGGSWSVAASPALSPGTYTARAQQTDGSSDTGYSSANTFTVDTTAPTVTLTTPANGSYTNSTMPTFSGTATTGGDESTTVTVKVYGGSNTTGTLVQTLTATESSGNWSVAASPALAPGTYTAQAQQSDTAGNTGFSSANTFTIDTTAPTVTLTAPTNGSYTNNTTPTFIGTATTGGDESTTVTVKVYSGTGTGGTPVQTLTTTESAGSWSVAPSPALAAGTYTARAQQSDAAGNTGFSSANTFTIDTTTPTVTLTTPANGSYTNNTTPTFSGTATTGGDESTTVTVKVYSGSNTTGTLLQTLTATESAGNWTVNASALTSGTYTARAQQSDAAGNTGFSSANTFTIDTTAPTVTLTTPTNGTYTNNTTPTFSGTATTGGDESTTVTVNVYSGTGTGGTPVQTLPTTESAGNWTVNASTLTSGTYTAQAQQSDTAGNTGYSNPVTFTIDTTAPAVTLSSPSNGSVTSNTTPTFSGTAATGGDESSTVTVKVYGGSNTTGTLVQTLTATESSGNWSVAASPALAPGTYTAQAQQSDTAGNTGFSSANTFTIDTTAPAVTLTSPANNGYTNQTKPTFSGSAGTAAGDSSVTVKIYSGSGASGTLLQTLTATQSGNSWSAVPSSALAPGTYTAQAQQSSAANLTGFSSANTFTIDTTAPTVTIVAPTAGSYFENTTPTLSGTATTGGDESTTVTVRVYSGAGTGGTPLQTLTTTESGGNWTVSTSALAPGNYTAQAQQSDTAGNTGYSSADSFTVVADELPSVAFSLTPTNPLTGSSVSFDGTASSDPDGTINTWAWNFGDGSAGANQPTASHTYNGPGSYSVTLTVTDSASNTGSAARTVLVGAVTSASPPSTSGASTTPPPPPLVAYLHVPNQKLGTALSQGIRIDVGASVAARATLSVDVGGSAARRLGHAAASKPTPRQLVVARMQVRSVGPRLTLERIRLKRRTVRLLRGAQQLQLIFRLTVVDTSGRSTTLVTPKVLHP